MELRQLRALVAIAEERHFGRAAARLLVAQPALSQQVKQLERELGTKVFERSSRRVELTEAGALLLVRARAVLSEIESAERDIALQVEGRIGRVSVGFVGTATYDVLPRVARAVRRQLPEIELDVRGELLTPQLVDGLHAGSFDLAVLRPGAAGLHGLREIHLREEPLVAVLPSGHPLAESASIAVADLAGETFVVHPSGHRSSMHERTLDVCRRHGFSPVELIEVGETGTLVVFVAAGLGVGLVPASVESLRLDGVSYRPLAGQPELVSLVLATGHVQTPAVARVADLIEQTVTDH